MTERPNRAGVGRVPATIEPTVEPMPHAANVAPSAVAPSLKRWKARVGRPTSIAPSAPRLSTPTTMSITRSGTSRHAYSSPSRMSPSVLLPWRASAEVPPPGRETTSAAARTDAAASTASAAPAPTAATSTPAAAEPSTIAAVRLRFSRALPAWSWSAETTRGSIAWPAGTKNAVVAPTTTAATSRCQNWSEPVRVRTARIATTPPRSRPDPSIVVRAEKRSLAAPPTSMRTAIGMLAAASTDPTARLEPVSWSASQATAT